MNKILELSNKYYNEVKRIRHYLHENPEPSFKEFKTAKFIRSELDKLGIKYEVVCETGTLAIIEGAKSGKCVLLRADIDALEITEEVDVSYKSKTEGLMHACGHDGHAASLLGAAMILNELKSEITGSVKLMFQPAEENYGGALPMIEAGILENPKVDAAFGIHLWDEGLVGTVGVKNGEFMAAPDDFIIKFTGDGGHASVPHLLADPVVMASQFVMDSQSIISRKVDPIDSAVLSICTINSGTTFNVIPEVATITGTIRTLNETTRTLIPEEMKKLAKAVCDFHGGSFEFEYIPGYPPLVNDTEMTNHVRSTISKMIGSENIIEIDVPSMGGEDFAYLCNHVPASFFLVGIATKDNKPMFHHPSFKWDDEVLISSSSYMAQVAFDFLNIK